MCLPLLFVLFLLYQNILFALTTIIESHPICSYEIILINPKLQFNQSLCGKGISLLGLGNSPDWLGQLYHLVKANYDETISFGTGMTN